MLFPFANMARVILIRKTMNALTEVQVLDAEERLRQAMMASDVAELTVLLADD